MKVQNISNLPLKDHNIVSFQKVSLEIPIGSILSSDRPVDIIIHKPKIVLNWRILKKTGASPPKSLPFAIRAVKISDGEIFFQGKKLFVHLARFNLDSVRSQEETLYQLQAAHLRAVFPIQGENVTVEGNVTCRFKQESDQVKLTQFTWNTRNFKVNAHGRIHPDNTLQLNAFIQGNPRHILRPVLKNLTIDGFLYGNASISLDTEKVLSVSGKFNSQLFSVADEPLSGLRGRVSWDTKDRRLRINAYFSDGDIGTLLHIESSQGGVTRLEANNIAIPRLVRIIKIDDIVPGGGIVEKGEIEIKKKVITGTVRLIPKSVQDSRFNLRGDLQFRYDSGKKTIHFQSGKLTGEFGEMTIRGDLIPPEKQIDIAINGRIKQMGEINKYTKFYISLDLDQWRLRRGEGPFSLHVTQDGDKVNTTGRFKVNNLYCRDQHLQSLEALIESRGNLVRGNFEIKDPLLTGRIDLLLNDQVFRIGFPDIQGEAEKMFRLLEIDLPMKGHTRGNYVYESQRNGTFPRVYGHITAEAIRFFEIPLQRLNSDFESNLENIKLTGCTYRCFQGKGSANIFIDFSKKQYSMRGKVAGINLGKISDQVGGRGQIEWQGAGMFNRDPIKASYTMEDFFFYKDRLLKISGQGNIWTDFQNFQVNTVGYLHHGSKKSPFNIEARQQQSNLSGSYKIHLKDINYLIPWSNNLGRLVLDGQFKTTSQDKLTTQGIAMFSGKVLALPNFPQALENFEGLVTFKDLNFTLSSLKGEMGRGSIEANGHISFNDTGLEDLHFNIDGRRINLFLMDRTSADINADLILKYQNDHLQLQGTINLLSALWEREIDEELSFITQVGGTGAGRSLLDLIKFDLNIQGRENIQMKNSFAEINGRVKLKLTGDLDFPILTGTIESRDGKIHFSDRTFTLIKGKLIFSNKFSVDPLLDLEAETFISNYRIKFNIKGSANKPQPEFISSPPLPPPDILALISLGELFERPTSTELSSQIGSTSMITDALTGELQRRVKKVLGIDILKIDPMINGTTVEGNSRVSVGKSIAKNFIVVYSTNISSSRQEIMYLLYQISPSLSLIGMRHADHSYTLDLRFRTRR